MTVVHPFHPLRSQRFEVLKQRRLGGAETLIIRHAELGSRAIARAWTDWAETPLEESSIQAISFDALWQLATLVTELKKPREA